MKAAYDTDINMAFVYKVINEFLALDQGKPDDKNNSCVCIYQYQNNNL